VPAPSWENLDAFLQDDAAGGFASSASIVLQDGRTLTVKGIFDEPYLNAQAGEYDFDTAEPRFTCKSSEVEDVTRGDELTLGGKTYDILASPMHDGTGLAVLKLAPR
jgi:hypothetical protein